MKSKSQSQYPGLSLTEPEKDQHLVDIFENMKPKIFIKINDKIDPQKWYSLLYGIHLFVTESDTDGKFQIIDNEQNKIRLIDKSDCKII